MAYFVVAEYGDGFVFAFLGFAVGGGGVVVHGEADSFAGEERHGGGAFYSAVDVEAGGTELFGHDFVAATFAFDFEAGLDAGRVDLAGGGVEVHDFAASVVPAVAGFEVTDVFAHFAELEGEDGVEVADFVVEGGLGVEDVLRGVADGGDAEEEGGDARGIPSLDSGELDGCVGDHGVAPVADVAPGIGKKVFGFDGHGSVCSLVLCYW